MKKIFLLLAVVVLASCNTRQGPSRPAATGRAGEMLVVMSNHRWEGPAGEAVREVFAANVPMLTAREPMFDLVQITENNFVKLFETHRHIFMADINPEHPRASIEVNQHQWSYPQMIIRVKAPNDSVFQRVMQRNAQSFSDYYVNMEMERLSNAYARMSNFQARTAIREKFDFDLVVPEGYFVAVEGDDFMWIRRTGTREDLEMGVMIATLPYRDPAVDFNPATIRARRDSLTRRYIPGQMPGSYMATYQELEHDYREVNFNGIYAMEARGLWRLEGDFMGGPFVNYTLVDQPNNRVIILDGFVYAPKFNKRDYLRQLEALLKTLSLNGAEENAEEEANPLIPSLTD